MGENRLRQVEADAIQRLALRLVDRHRKGQPDRKLMSLKKSLLQRKQHVNREANFAMRARCGEVNAENSDGFVGFGSAAFEM